MPPQLVAPEALSAAAVPFDRIRHSDHDLLLGQGWLIRQLVALVVAVRDDGMHISVRRLELVLDLLIRSPSALASD
eukprot:111418-Prymnesium_polylepis.2